MRLVSPVLLMAAVLFGLAAPGDAQGISGDIRGVVIDQAGAALPGVEVTVIDTATAVERGAVTDAAGRFAAAALPVGPYELTARLPGFAARRQEGLQVQAGATIAVRLELTRAALPDTLTVGGVAASVEATRSSQGSVIPAAVIENLPLDGRNVIDLLALTPGVTRRAGTGEFIFTGQRETLSRLVVDGGDDRDALAARGAHRTASASSFPLPVEAVQEIRVDTNAYAAEYGGAGAGLVSLISRSGANAFSGAAFDFYRDDGLSSGAKPGDDRNQAKDPFHVNQFGGVLGGPIARNRHFFFVAYQGQRGAATDTSSLLSLPQPPPPSAFAFTTVRYEGDGVRMVDNHDAFVARTDHRVGATGVTLRYQSRQFDTRPDTPGLFPSALTSPDPEPSYRRAFNATAASVLGPGAVNDFRVQYGRERERTGPFVAARAGIGPGLVMLDTVLQGERVERLHRTQVADTLSWVLGPHLLKAGGDLQFDRTEDRAGAAAQVFLTDQGIAGTVSGAATTAVDNREQRFFVQDAWRAGQATTLNLGLRYDGQRFSTPAALPVEPGLTAAGLHIASPDADTDNWGPRLGVAWSPAGSRRVVRAGYGLFYGRTPAMATVTRMTDAIAVGLPGAGSLSAPPDLSGSGLTVPAASLVAGRSIFVASAGLQSPRVQQASIGVDWEWMPYTSIGFSYLHARGDHLPRLTDINIGAPAPAAFTVAGGGPAVTAEQFAPGPFGNGIRVISYESAAESRYDAVVIELQRRFAQSSYYRVSYTLGKAVDTAPEADRSVAAGVAGDVEAARRPADGDQRHRLVASVVYLTSGYASGHEGVMRELLTNWTLSALLTMGSGQPYSAYAAADLDRDGNRFNDLAPGTTRNQYNLPKQATLDGRLAREVRSGGKTRVSLILEVFNAANQSNYTAVNDILYTVSPANPNTLVPNPLFGERIAPSTPRTAQLAIRFAF